MKVNLLVFAGLKDVLGFEQTQLVLALGAQVKDAIGLLEDQYPLVKPLVPVLCAAVDQEFASHQSPLFEGCELALFTPVGGG